MLSFSKIPEDIITAIGDLTKVSSRTAETIKRLANKGDVYVSALISKADLIRSGKLGNKSLPEIIEQEIHKPEKTKEENKKIFSFNGRHLFTIRKDNNDLPSIHFPKSIVSLIDKKKLSMDSIIGSISIFFEKELDNLKEKN